nr:MULTISPECIES: hypothetical protein [Pseudomonas]
MPLTEKELTERDAKRNIGEELLASIRDVKIGLVQEADNGKFTTNEQVGTIRVRRWSQNADSTSR